MNLFDIRDKVVVITGGTGVLGRTIASHLAEEGAKVVVLGRKAEVGNALVAQIKSEGREAMFLTTDVMNREKLEKNLEDILAAYGRVDALLNAAGGNMPEATIAPDGTYTAIGNDVIRQTPFGRMGRAEELCGTIQYLISEASSFVTGTVAIVDGGFNAYAM